MSVYRLCQPVLLTGFADRFCGSVLQIGLVDRLGVAIAPTAGITHGGDRPHAGARSRSLPRFQIIF
jgi:hypothetical protein